MLRFLALSLSFFLILFTTIFWQNSLNQKRAISFEPDDYFHFIIKSSNIKHCAENLCFEENLFLEDANTLNEEERFSRDRQIHRIIFSYQPLFTFLIEKISNLNNIFKAQKYFNFVIGFFQGLIIFYYLKNNLSRNQLFIISLILSTFCFNNFWGISYPASWSLSATLGLLGVYELFNKKYLGLLYLVIASLFHKIGLILICLGFSTWFIYSLLEYFKNKKIHNKFFKEVIQNVFLYSLIILFCYKIKYSVFDLKNMNEFNLYEFQYSFASIFFGVFSNIQEFIKHFKSLFFLNPILFPFFVATFFLQTNNKILIIKIFTISLLLFMIVYFVPSGGSYFSIGFRTWHLFIINYLILSIYSLYALSEKIKHIRYIKYLFIFFIPVFSYIGLTVKASTADFLSIKDNNYYNYENIINIQKLITTNSSVYFNTKESTFYYYLISGFIKNNFYFKDSNPSFLRNKTPRYLILDNPIQAMHGSDPFLIDNLKIKISTAYENYSINLYSNQKSEIKINNSLLKINKGYNLIKLNEKNILFKNIKHPIRITGLILDQDQKTNWPWGEDISVDFEYNIQKKIKYSKIFTKAFFDKEYVAYSYKNNFKKIKKNIFQQFNTCEKTIISDVDSTLVLELSC
tara:strand:- start:479 stop:2368 length:1890 start_codon:yes stop_codon:yes gene_type:complete